MYGMKYFAAVFALMAILSCSPTTSDAVIKHRQLREEQIAKLKPQSQAVGISIELTGENKEILEIKSPLLTADDLLEAVVPNNEIFIRAGFKEYWITDKTGSLRQFDSATLRDKTVALKDKSSESPTAAKTPDTRTALDILVDGVDDIRKSRGDDESYAKAAVALIDDGITYEMLKKDASKYIGKGWGFTGKILEIKEKNGITIARIGLDPYGSKPVWVQGRLTTDFVEDNRVYVVGVLAGDYTYKSQANWSITIPALVPVAIMKPEKAKQYTKRK